MMKSYQQPVGLTGMRAGLVWRLRAKSMRYQRPDNQPTSQESGPLVSLIAPDKNDTSSPQVGFRACRHAGRQLVLSFYGPLPVVKAPAGPANQSPPRASHASGERHAQPKWLSNLLAPSSITMRYAAERR